MTTKRVLFVSAQTSVRAQIAADLVRENALAPFIVDVLQVDAAQGLPEADLVVVLGMDAPPLTAPCPLLRWDIEEPETGVSYGPFDAARHAERAVRLHAQARLGMLDDALGLPNDVAIGPEDLPLTVVARRAGKVVGRATLEEIGGFALLRIEHDVDADAAVACMLIADRVALARVQATHTVFAIAEESAYLPGCGFRSVQQAPTIVREALAGQTPQLLGLQLADNRATQSLLDDDIARELSAQNQTLMPPWAKHPALPRRSIAWRMGDGEWYSMMWHRWWSRLSPEAQAAYAAEWKPRTPPEFVGWLPFG